VISSQEHKGTVPLFGGSSQTRKGRVLVAETGEDSGGIGFRYRPTVQELAQELSGFGPITTERVSIAQVAKDIGCVFTRQGTGSVELPGLAPSFETNG
jgi:hypothetical protein